MISQGRGPEHAPEQARNQRAEGGRKTMAL